MGFTASQKLAFEQTNVKCPLRVADVTFVSARAEKALSRPSGTGPRQLTATLSSGRQLAAT